MLTKEQKERRRGGVGASEIAVLAGLSRWSSPIALYEAKVYEAPELDSYPADLGNELEDPIARVWAKRNGRAIAKVDTLQHPAKPFALATPDRAVFASGSRRPMIRDHSGLEGALELLQVKSTNWRMRREWGEEGTDQVPEDYLAQAHWEGAVAGLDVVTFAVDFDKTQLHTYRVVVRLDIFEQLYEIAARFMVDHVRARKPPPPDYSERYEEVIGRFWPREANRRTPVEPVDPELQPELWKAIELYAKIKAAEARLKPLKQHARNVIVSNIGEGTGFGGPWGKVTWLANKDSQATAWRELAQELELVASLAVQTLAPSETRTKLEQQLATLRAKHTKTKKGPRVLRGTWEGELRYDVERLELALDRATAGGLDAGDENEEA